MNKLQQSQTPTRIIYFDYLRIAAMSAIIVLHVAAQNLRAVSIASSAWNTFNIYDSLTRWGVPIFVMISGALFLSKDQPIKKIYQKNILKMLVVLILWTIIYNVWQLSLHNDLLTFKGFLTNLATEPYYLWFLYMIIGLYIVTPLLRQLVNNKKATKYFLILSFLFAFLIPELIEILSLKSKIIANLIEEKVSLMQIFMVLGFTGYYILGYYLNKYTIKRKTEIIIYIAGIIGILFTILATTLSSLFKGELITFFYDNLTINVAATSIAIFVFFKQHLNQKLTFKKAKLLQFFSRCSLGVYLVHVIILETMDAVFNLNSLSFNPIISVPLLSSIILLLSYTISIILYATPSIGKWIV